MCVNRQWTVHVSYVSTLSAPEQTVTTVRLLVSPTVRGRCVGDKYTFPVKCCTLTRGETGPNCLEPCPSTGRLL